MEWSEMKSITITYIIAMCLSSCNAATGNDTCILLGDNIRFDVSGENNSNDSELVKSFVKPLLQNVQKGDREFFKEIANNNHRKSFIYWPWWSGEGMSEEYYDDAMNAVADDFMVRSIGYKDYNLRSLMKKCVNKTIHIHTNETRQEVWIIIDKLCYQIMLSKNEHKNII